MNIKQLLCRHIWRNEKMEYLRSNREQYGESWVLPIYANFAYYSQKQHCPKCSRDRVIEKRILCI